MITKIIATIIITDGILSYLTSNIWNPDEKHHKLLQTGRTIRTILGIILTTI